MKHKWHESEKMASGYHWSQHILPDPVIIAAALEEVKKIDEILQDVVDEQLSVPMEIVQAPEVRIEEPKIEPVEEARPDPIVLVQPVVLPLPVVVEPDPLILQIERKRLLAAMVQKSIEVVPVLPRPEIIEEVHKQINLAFDIYLDTYERSPKWNDLNPIERMVTSMHKKNILVKTSDGHRIIQVNPFSVHSHKLSHVPPGFEPGDERFITVGPQGQVTFDRDGHAEHKSKRDEKRSWNTSGPIDRLKQKLKGD